MMFYPEKKELPPLEYYEEFIRYFTYSLEDNEEIVSIGIGGNNLPDYIQFDDYRLSFFGKFLPPDGGTGGDDTKLEADALKYVIGQKYYATDSFDKLPPRNECDLYYFKAPNVKIGETFTILMEAEVKIKGTDQVSKYVKEYTQKVGGGGSNFDHYKEIFLKYMRG